MDSHSLLQIATRIHYALLREIGTGIDIGAMLGQQGYAQEVIYLCRACKDPEIRALGERFESLAPEDPPLEKHMARAARPAHRAGLGAELRDSLRAAAPAHRHPKDFSFDGACATGTGNARAMPRVPSRSAAADGTRLRRAH